MGALELEDLDVDKLKTAKSQMESLKEEYGPDSHDLLDKEIEALEELIEVKNSSVYAASSTFKRYRGLKLLFRPKKKPALLQVPLAGVITIDLKGWGAPRRHLI